MQNQNPLFLSSLPRIYKSCALNFLFLRTIIYIHVSITITAFILKDFFFPPSVSSLSHIEGIKTSLCFLWLKGRRCWQVLSVWSSPVKIPWQRDGFISVLEGGCSSGLGALTVLTAVFTEGDRVERKPSNQSVDRNFFFSYILPVDWSSISIKPRNPQWNQQVGSHLDSVQRSKFNQWHQRLHPSWNIHFLIFFLNHQAHWMIAPLPFVCGGVC